MLFSTYLRNDVSQEEVIQRLINLIHEAKASRFILMFDQVVDRFFIDVICVESHLSKLLVSYSVIFLNRFVI